MANGIYNSGELIDTIIVDCNNAVRNLVGGNYISWCNIMYSIVQRLCKLKEGIAADIDGKNKVIEELKQQLRNAGTEITEFTPEEFLAKQGKKDGAE